MKTFKVCGSHGNLVVDTSGAILDRSEQDSDEYSDIERFDVLATLANIGSTLDDLLNFGEVDILYTGYWYAGGKYEPPMTPEEHQEMREQKGPGLGQHDPNGLDQHAPGAKLDAGKSYADDILAGFSRALSGVIAVGTFGANKYSLGGWQSVDDGIRRYRNAAARHRLARQSGELIDPESGFSHEYHEAWNVLAALELTERSK